MITANIKSKATAEGYHLYLPVIIEKEKDIVEIRGVVKD